MVITAITFFVIKQHVHTCTEGINNRNKNVLFKTTFAASYSPFFFSLLATGLDVVNLSPAAALMRSPLEQIKCSVSGCVRTISLS